MTSNVSVSTLRLTGSLTELNLELDVSVSLSGQQARRIHPLLPLAPQCWGSRCVPLLSVST